MNKSEDQISLVSSYDLDWENKIHKLVRSKDQFGFELNDVPNSNPLGIRCFFFQVFPYHLNVNDTLSCKCKTGYNIELDESVYDRWDHFSTKLDLLVALMSGFVIDVNFSQVKTNTYLDFEIRRNQPT